MRERPDIYIAPSSFIVPSFLPRGIRCIPVVHDLIAFHSDPHEWKAKWIERMTLGRTLRNAAHICTMSNATKADLLQQFPSVRPDGISTVYAGPLDFDPPRSHPDHRTILCPGTLCPRKNQLRLLQAYAGLPTELRDHYRLLLIGGRGWNDREIVALVQKTPGAQWLGYVPDKEYRALLSHCTILAFPSLYEGFGLPVLDALQRGIPVLTTNRGSLPEVAGDCAVMVDPLSVESIRSGLLEMLTDAALLLKLQQKGPSQAKKFSWERTADLLRSVLQ
jgi:alpha-1,3-rhamnosyl/mannosyltransferase